MTTPTQERARELAANLRGWKAGENASDDTVRCIWLMHKAADEIDALLAHGLAERRAGFQAGAKAEVDAMVQAICGCRNMQELVDAINATALCALPLPGDDRE